MGPLKSGKEHSEMGDKSPKNTTKKNNQKKAASTGKTK